MLNDKDLTILEAFFPHRVVLADSENIEFKLSVGDETETVNVATFVDEGLLQCNYYEGPVESYEGKIQFSLTDVGRRKTFTAIDIRDTRKGLEVV